MKTYQTRQHETFGPLPDNEWADTTEDIARATLGNRDDSAWKWPALKQTMERGDTVTYCGLIDFRLTEKE